MRLPVIVVVVAFGLVPLAAQHDDQTDDYERQDEKYYQRYLEQQKEPEQPEPPPETDGPNTEAFIALAVPLLISTRSGDGKKSSSLSDSSPGDQRSKACSNAASSSGCRTRLSVRVRMAVFPGA